MAAAPRSHAVPARSGRWGSAPLVAAAVLLGSGLLYAPASASGPTATLTIGPSVAVSHAFWSVNIGGSSFDGNHTLAALVNATPFVYLRYNMGDAANLSNTSLYPNGCDYLDNGTCAAPWWNFSALRTFCGWVHCRLILSIPAETNDPGLAYDTVRTLEQTYRLHPAYVSIGNEPELWRHWDIPYAQWKVTDHSRPTPLQYAQEVGNFTRAIHQADPSIAIIGDQSDNCAVAQPYFDLLAQYDNASLAAVACHEYPSNIGPSPISLAQFLSPRNLTATEQFWGNATRGYDHVCGCQKPIFIGEVNGALQGRYNSYLSGFPDVIFTAAVTAQALAGSIPMLGFFDLFGGNGNMSALGLLNVSSALPGAQPTPTYTLYTLLHGFPMAAVHPVSIASTVTNAYAVEGVSRAGLPTLLVVNANTSGTPLSFSLPWTGRSLATTDSAAGVTATRVGNGTNVLTVPALSVLIVSELGHGGGRATGHVSPGGPIARPRRSD